MPNKEKDKQYYLCLPEKKVEKKKNEKKSEFVVVVNCVDTTKICSFCKLLCFLD